MTVSMTAGGVEMAGGSRIIVDSSSGDVFALNAYGGAVDGGPVLLYQNCPKSNPDCMWYLRHGMIVSARNSALAVRPAGPLSSNPGLVLDSNCTSDLPECTWRWHMGLLQNGDDPAYAINASGGPVNAGPLVLDNSCTESNANCTFTIENARLSLAADHRTGIYAGDAPANGSTAQLAAIWPCPISDSRCTWTLRRGLVTSDFNPALAMYASTGTVGVTVPLRSTCTSSDPKCTWTFDGRSLRSDVPFTGMSGPASLTMAPSNGPLLNLGGRKAIRLVTLGAAAPANKECDSASPPGPACAAGYHCQSNNNPIPVGSTTNDWCSDECRDGGVTNPACTFEVGSPVPIAWSGVPAAKAKWTLMVLHFTDGDFSDDVIWDEGRMGQSGSTPDVNIVALLDTPSYDRRKNYVPLYRGLGVYLRVNRNASPTILSELGEVDMGDPNVEGDFADFIATYFPADNYAVTTYDHGSGWYGFGGDLTGSGIDTPAGELAQMLGRMNTAFGKKVGVFGSDGCNVGTWELASAAFPYAEFTVASEAGVGPTLNYAQFLPTLVATPTLSAQALASEMTTTFVWGGDALLETMAATEISSAHFGTAGAVTSAVTALAQALRDPVNYPCLEQARLAANHIGDAAYPNGLGYIDLYTLAGHIGSLCTSPVVQTLATATQTAVANAIVTTNYSANPGGLSIYVPERCSAMDPYYFDAAGAVWSQQTEWDELMRGFAPPTNEMTTGETNRRPLPVNNVVALPINPLMAQLSWSPSPTYGSTYTVRRGTSPGSHPANYVVPYAAGTVWMDSGLDSETRYYYVVVADNCTQESDSSAEVSVGPPSVAITSPTDNAELGPPATVTVTVAASDPDVGDGISMVELYQDGILVDTDTSAPYSFTVSSLPLGSYVFTAKAYDLTGFVATSAPITVNVVVSYPCDGICSPWVSRLGPGIQQGYLGTAEVCDQTMATLAGGNCGNMSDRTFTVNGQGVPCNGQTWPTLPAKRNGGYCLHATAGGLAYAYYTTW